MIEQEPLTLEDVSRLFNKRVIQRIVEDLLRPNPLFEMLERNMPKPTRCQRLTAPWKWRLQRVKDAWGVLTGRLDAN